MKNRFFILGMTVLILSLGLVFVGCGSDNAGGPEFHEELRGEWKRGGVLHLTIDATTIDIAHDSVYTIVEKKGSRYSIKSEFSSGPRFFTPIITSGTLEISDWDGTADINGTYTR